MNAELADAQHETCGGGCQCRPGTELGKSYTWNEDGEGIADRRLMYIPARADGTELK